MTHAADVRIVEGFKRRLRDIDRLIADLAAHQHGVVASWQLLRLGISRRAIQHRLETGRLHVLHRGVYAVGHSAVSPRGRMMAAALSCGPRGVLSHVSGATIWGIPSFHGTGGQM